MNRRGEYLQRIFLWNSKFLRFIDMNNSLMYIIQITDLHRKCDLFFCIGQRKTKIVIAKMDLTD